MFTENDESLSWEGSKTAYAQANAAYLKMLGRNKIRAQLQEENDEQKKMCLAYLLSDEWEEKREQALAKAHYKCESCSSKKGLQVHSVDKEKEENLQVICSKCVVNAKRRERAKLKREAKCITQT